MACIAIATARQTPTRCPSNRVKPRFPAYAATLNDLLNVTDAKLVELGKIVTNAERDFARSFGQKHAATHVSARLNELKIKVKNFRAALALANERTNLHIGNTFDDVLTAFES